jgi:hypothetical protein
MRSWILAVGCAAALASLPGVTFSKGCLKGAAVGAVAGHVAGHHAVAGAAAGCAIGHHHEKVKERAARQPKPAQPTPPPAAADDGTST